MAHAISTQFDCNQSDSERTDPHGTLPPMESLQVLTDETRRAIVTTLRDADEPLQFSTLRRRAGIGDSGRFNYHLQKLRQRCVRTTEDGYELTPAGERFIAALCAVPALE